MRSILRLTFVIGMMAAAVPPAFGDAQIVTSTADREIRFRFPHGRWTEFRIRDGEAILRRTEDQLLVAVSTVENCRAGGSAFVKDFAKSYRRGRILEPSKLERPGSVLVEDLSLGEKLVERFDASSNYARFLLYLESEMTALERSAVVKCPRAAKVSR